MGLSAVRQHPGSMSAVPREAVGMPVPGSHLTLATLLGAAEALVVESVEGDVVVLSGGPGLHEGAKASTRIYDGERVWHLTFRVSERHELVPGQARLALHLDDRVLLGEERGLPRVPCRLAATARRAGEAEASVWATVVNVSQGGLALRSGRRLRRRRPDRRRPRRRHGLGDQRAARGRRPDRRRGRRDRQGAHRRRRRRRRPAPRGARRPPARLAERRRAAARAAARAARGDGRSSPPAAVAPRYAQRGGADVRHIGGVARTRDHGGRLRPARGARARSRGDPHRSGAAPGGLRPQPAAEDRAGRHRDPGRRAARAHAGRAAGADRAQSRPRQLGRRDERLAGHARRSWPRSPLAAAARCSCRGPVTPISRAS